MKYLLIAVLLLPAIAIASTSEVDSLVTLLQTADQDTNKVNILLKLSTLAYSQSEPNEGLAYAIKAENLASEIDFTVGRCNAIYYQGFNHWQLGNNDKSILLYKTALEIANTNKLNNLSFRITNNLGASYNHSGEHVLALGHFLNCLDIKIPNQKPGFKSKVYSNIGNIYGFLQNHDKAIEYFNLSLNIMSDNNTLEAADAFSNLGSSYHQLEQYDRAMEYHLKALKIREEFAFQFGLAISYINLADTYLAIGDLEKAEQNAEQARELWAKFKNPEGLILSQTIHANIMLKSDELDSSIKLLNSTLGLAENFGNASYKQNIHELLGVAMAQKGDHQQAYFHNRIHSALMDSLNNLTRLSAISSLELDYNRKARDNKMLSEAKLLLQKTKSRKLLFTITTIALGIISFILVLINKLKASKNLLLTELNDTLNEKVNQRTAELRKLASHLIDSREKERKKIARDIHDQLGQSLTAINMDVSRIEKNTKDPKTRKCLSDTGKIVFDTIINTQNILKDLRPAVIDEFGFVGALNTLAQSHRKQYGIEINLSTPDSVECNEKTAVAFFRIAQESLTNIAKHSEASAVEIVLEQNEAQLSMTIKDNGKGFDVDNRTSRSFGLIGMEERAIAVSGKFEYESTQNIGTTVTLTAQI